MWSHAYPYPQQSRETGISADAVRASPPLRSDSRCGEDSGMPSDAAWPRIHHSGAACSRGMLLWLCGLGLPIVLWHKKTYFTRRIDHRVHKVISL